MKRLLFFSMLVFGLLINFEGKSQDANNDPEAEKTLNSISQKISGFESISMDFVLGLEFPGQTVELQKGVFIQSGEKFFLDMDMQAVYCDGESLWIHLKNNKEVQWNDAETANESGFLDPNALMNLYKTGEFEYAITNAYRKGGNDIQEIEFKPLDKSSPYSKMRMVVDKTALKVESIRVFSKDGSRYSLEIDKLEANPQVVDSQFVFDPSKFPDVHVEDLRM